jgi:MFS family permease
MSHAVNAPNGDRGNDVADHPAGTPAPAATTDDTAVVPDRREVVGRQKDAFGGMKFGSCFFGWLTAAGTAVLLTALVTGIGAALGLSRNVEAAGTSATQAQSVGLVGGIVLLAIIFVAYLAGGYVAGRMARFNGLKQGLGVWLWAVIIAILVGVAGWLAGAKFDILAQLNSFPRLPLNEGTLTTGGIIVAIGVVVVSLAGALLGGLAGMRYHRRVDRAGLGR